MELTNLFGTARALRRGVGGARRRAGPRTDSPPPSLGSSGGRSRRRVRSSRSSSIPPSPAPSGCGEIAAELDDRLRIRFGLQSEETVTPFSTVRRATPPEQPIRIHLGRPDSAGDFVRRARGSISPQPAGARGIVSRRVRRKRQVTTLESDISVTVPLRGSTGLFLGTRGYVRDAPNEGVRPELLFPVGGAANLRGFEERRFRTGLGATPHHRASPHPRRRRHAGRGVRRRRLPRALANHRRRRHRVAREHRAGFPRGESRGLVGVDLAASDEIRAYGDVRLHLTYETRY